MSETAQKLRSHIMDGESHIIALNSMVTVAMLLATSALARSTDEVDVGPSEDLDHGIDTAVDEIAKRATAIHSWWNQLHEIGVAQPREKANG